MDGDDRVRRFHQDPRGPQGMVEVAAGLLQLGGQPAVQNECAAGGKERGERIGRHAHEPESIGYW